MNCDRTAADFWSLAEGVTYLNHGSFGPSPRPVIEAREALTRELEANPMHFFVRQLGVRLEEAAARLAAFLKCPADRLVFVPNSTVGMNVVARNLSLQPGDEVLLTDHEYGAVVRIWGQACAAAGARTVLARLPLPLDSSAEIVEAIFERVTPRTRLLVVSHVTSQTAAILPVREICARAREAGIMTCVDGPHAPVQIDVDLQSIPCDFYTASCHKWLSAPFGSGFLCVQPRHKQGLLPPVVSWGRSLQGDAPSWKDEFHWPGTYDPIPWLAVPAAIDFVESYGLQRFQRETHELARFAREQLLAIPGASPLTADRPDCYGSMVTVRLPLPDEAAFPGRMHSLQSWLWESHRMEIPVIRWRESLHLRISCHLYNTREQISGAAGAVRAWIEQQGA